MRKPYTVLIELNATSAKDALERALVVAAKANHNELASDPVAGVLSSLAHGLGRIEVRPA